MQTFALALLQAESKQFKTSTELLADLPKFLKGSFS